MGQAASPEQQQRAGQYGNGQNGQYQGQGQNGQYNNGQYNQNGGQYNNGNGQYNNGYQNGQRTSLQGGQRTGRSSCQWSQDCTYNGNDGYSSTIQ